MEIKVKQIFDKALTGEGITFSEANILINSELTSLEELIKTSNILTSRSFGNRISMCAIYPAKVGQCSGDCAFCAQSSHHSCDVVPVNVSELSENKIVKNAKKLCSIGVKRYSLVTSGERLTEKEFDRILHIFKRLSEETEIGLCASLGSLTIDRAVKLKNVGVTRYHHNIETSSSYFPKICSTHSYDDKIETIEIARQIGMEICSGGIIAMGETPRQRIEMAFELKDLDVDCIPINILNPIKGTKLENQRELTTDEIIRTIAVFRLIMPNKALRFAGGREKALGADEYKGYKAGINSMIVGNYLTTNGKDLKEAIHILEASGFEVQ